MVDPHIGDLAELYALGELDANDVVTVEEHIATCAACLRRVGEAEETVLALERGNRAEIAPLELRRFFPPRPRLPYAVLALATAAALVLGIFIKMLLPGAPPSDTQQALVAMVESHFNHAQFAPVGAQSAPPAKVIYARDKHWLFIIANGAERYDVYAVAPSGATLLGTLRPSGSSSTLYVDRPVMQSTIELRAGATVVERAALR